MSENPVPQGFSVLHTPISNKEEQKPNTQTKRRKQVKKACVSCRAAHARCDENRPCTRCIKHGMQDYCFDAKTKKRGRKAASIVEHGQYKEKLFL